LSLLQQNNVILSENSWDDIVNKYKLHKELEVIIRENIDSSSVSLSDTAPLASGKGSAWTYRVLLVAATVTLIGNFPVQSRLSTPSTYTYQSFAITPAHSQFITPITSVFSAKPIVSKAKVSPDKNTKIANLITTNKTEITKQKAGSFELSLPKKAIETYAGHVLERNNTKWVTYHVKSYDNLTNIFHKLNHQKTLKTLKNDKTIYKELETLNRGGAIVRASSNEEGQLSELVFTHDSKNSYVLTLADEKYTGTWQKGIFETRQARASFTIKHGLFFDGRKVGIATKVIQKIVKVFDWDIDFSHDIRIGDKVTAVFEEIYHDGDKVDSKNLLAAEFINKNRVLRTVRYTFKDGKSDFFTPDGREMKKAFIRTPISHARISSHFNPGRLHPVLHTIRSHKGTDFAARKGTPIKATGNATITFIGTKGGYGKMIILSHREGYSTRYGHMSRYKKGLKTGDKVYQGDIIGYVGSSGLATGPHCHYELRKDGKPIDPMKAHLPNSMSLAKSELQDFRNKAINLVLQLNVLHRFVEADIEIDSAIGG